MQAAALSIICLASAGTAAAAAADCHLSEADVEAVRAAQTRAEAIAAAPFEGRAFVRDLSGKPADTLEWLVIDGGNVGFVTVGFLPSKPTQINTWNWAFDQNFLIEPDGTIMGQSEEFQTGRAVEGYE